MYLALKDKGLFRSTDGGTRWVPLNDGLTVSEKISAMTAVGKTVFAGTENGLYRLDSGVLEEIATGYIRSRLFLGCLWD